MFATPWSRWNRAPFLAGLLALCAADAPASPAPCPEGMSLVAERFCIDRFEAAVEALDEAGHPTQLHPHNREVGKKTVRAVSRPGLFPQAHISRNEAQAACERAGKRLCSGDEWLTACRGTSPTVYPYGPRFRSGACNDEGVSPLRKLHGTSYAHDHATMNDPRLDLVAGTVARTGSFSRCTGGWGVHDMVGNLHEWTAGNVFRGGYFLDTHTLGQGCSYETAGHGPDYRDYSTGFRCCADAAR